MPPKSSTKVALDFLASICTRKTLLRSGQYRNRAGELVTWESGMWGHGTYVELHTWPNDKEEKGN